MIINNMTFHSNNSLPQCPHDEIVLGEPLFQNNHFFWVHRRRILNSSRFWLRLWVITWFSTSDSLHKNSTGGKDPCRWSPRSPTNSLEHTVGADKAVYTLYCSRPFSNCVHHTEIITFKTAFAIHQEVAIFMHSEPGRYYFVLFRVPYRGHRVDSALRCHRLVESVKVTHKKRSVPSEDQWLRITGRKNMAHAYVS